MPRLALIAVTALVLLAGCNSSDSKGASDDHTTPSATPTTTTTEAPSGPACKDIWKAGATLPADYASCVEDGAYGSQDVTKCQDGTKLVVYFDAYYAVTGGTILKPKVAPLQDTEDFGKVYRDCTGE